MLIITRYDGQDTVLQFPEGIEPGATVTIKAIRCAAKNRMKLGITAPKSVVVLRQEVIDRQAERDAVQAIEQ